MKGIQERKTKDGQTHYRVQIRIKGHPIVRATFKRKTDAQRWKQMTECSIREGKYFKTAEAKKHTLRRVLFDDTMAKDHWHTILIKTATRLLDLHAKTVGELARYRKNGEQLIVVQHVNIENGGQAIVGGQMKAGRG